MVRTSECMECSVGASFKLGRDLLSPERAIDWDGTEQTPQVVLGLDRASCGFGKFPVAVTI